MFCADASTGILTAHPYLKGEQVADIAHPLALARSVGVRDEDLYDPTHHGSRTGAFDG